MAMEHEHFEEKQRMMPNVFGLVLFLFSAMFGWIFLMTCFFLKPTMSTKKAIQPCFVISNGSWFLHFSSKFPWVKTMLQPFLFWAVLI